MRYSVKTILALAFLALTNPAQAVTVDLEGTTAVGIRNLEFGGSFWNVSFNAGVWPDVFGQPPEFEKNPLAPALVEAINATLTVFQARSVGEPGSSIDAGFYQLPVFFDENENGLDWLGGYYADRFENGAWLDQLADKPFGGDAWPVTFPGMWADVELVPIPAAVWLFGSALGLLGWVRRRAT